MDRIRLNASEWMDFRSGEKKCFLLTNGLGGYCSLTVMGNAARNDQALLMGALKAPTVREHLISNVWETLEVDGEETELFSQEFVNRTQNVEGFRFLEGFEMGSLPVWFYPVSYTHLDVYKRQRTYSSARAAATRVCLAMASPVSPRR